MKSINKALGIGALALALCGCTDNQNQYQTIMGNPISVGESFGQNIGSLAVVVDVEGKHLLAYTIKGYPQQHAEAMALIQSEIADGDKELIEIMGKYDGDKFEIKTINANGYRVDFE